jgi:hypothetical protein
MAVTEQARALAQTLTEVGVRATIDPTLIQPPCVLVAPNGFTFNHLGGCVEYRFNLYLVAPGVRAADSLPVLDGLVAQVRGVLDIRDAEPGTVTFGDGELPAYICPIEVTAEF